MHRIDTLGSVEGKFDEGNPATGQRATRISADWMNDVQEAICYVIEQQGIELEKGDETQLRAAILALVAGVVGSGGGAVPTTRQVNTSGLATGGGDLAANRTISVPKASSAETAAGSLDTKAITPAALASAFAGVAALNGYIPLPGGWLIQFGYLRGAYSEGGVAVTFPTAFPTACYAVIPVAVNLPANNNYDVHVQNVSKSPTGASFYFNFSGSGSSTINGLDYIAIGK